MMHRFFARPVLAIYLTIALAAAPSRAQGASQPKLDDRILRAQLFLDSSDFKPGAIDGRWGEFMHKALTRYEQAQGKSAADFSDTAPAKFDLPFDSSRPVLSAYRITESDQAFVGELPDSHEQQEKLERLPYQNLQELVAEKFHTRRDFLEQINPDFKWSEAKPGDEVQVPNVATPFDLQAVLDLKKKTDQAEKADKLKTEKDKPDNEQAAIFVDVAEKILEVKRGDKVIGSYPITPGSSALPAPSGEWFIRGFAWMPTFRWDEAMLKRGERSNDSFELPPGPNNPVGIVWMELNRDGIGVHGTEDPETIGRAASHGCIRLSNWDALDLGQKVLPGVHVLIP
ncbi:MAG: L,D-transpeptidase [Chthoniobacterales bacterium]